MNQALVTEKKRRFNWPRIFGYDFFISFKLGPPPLGAQSYSSDLARRLRELDFTVFFSEEEAPPGAKLDSTLIKALHKSRILVVIANEGALLHSPWIRREVEEFRRKHPNRPVIPVNIDHAIEKHGVQADAANWLGYKGKIWLDESTRAIETGITTPEVLKRLEIAPQFIRSNTRLRWAITLIIFLLSGLASWAGFEAWDANRKYKDTKALNLVSEGVSITSGRRPGNTIKGLFKVIAGHRLSRSNITYESLQSEYLRFYRMIYIRDTKGANSSVAVSPDGSLILAGGASLMLWDVKTGKILRERNINQQSRINSVAFSPDGTHFVTGSEDRTLQLWRTRDYEPEGPAMTGHEKAITSVAFSPTNERIVSGSEDNTLRLWDAKTSKQIGQPLKAHTDEIISVTFSPDARTIVSAGRDWTVRFWDAENGQPLGQSIDDYSDWVNSIAYSPDGNRIVTGGYDHTVRLWDAKTGKQIGQPLNGHTTSVSSVVFSHDGRRIVSASADSSLRIWNAMTGEAEEELEGHNKLSVNSIGLSADGNQIVSVSSDNTLRAWNSEEGQSTARALTNLQELLRPVGPILSMAISPDGSLLIFSVDDGNNYLWDIKSERIVAKLPKAHEGTVISFAFSPDGKRIVTGGSDHTLRLWDAKTRQPLSGALSGHESWVNSVAFSLDGKFIVSGSGDKTLRLWDAHSGRGLRLPITGHLSSITSVAVSPESNLIVSGSDDHTIRLWDVKTGTQVGHSLEGHANRVTSVAFSPDGHRIVSGSTDQTVRLWDVSTPNTTTLPSYLHDSGIDESRFGAPYGVEVHQVMFTSDGKRIVAASNTGFRFLNAQTGELIGLPMKSCTFHCTFVITPDSKQIIYSEYRYLHQMSVFEGWADELCKKLGRNMSHKEWREWVSPDIDYIEQCPGLPIPPDEPETTTVATEQAQP